MRDERDILSLATFAMIFLAAVFRPANEKLQHSLQKKNNKKTKKERLEDRIGFLQQVLESKLHVSLSGHDKRQLKSFRVSSAGHHFDSCTP